MTSRRDDAAADPGLEAAGAWCVRLAEGEPLSPQETARLQAWLAEDSANREALEDSVGIWRALGEDSLSPTLIGMRREALGSFERASRRRWRRDFPTGRAAAVAACLLLALGVWGWIALVPVVYRTGLGERRVVRLEDGSRLSLDARTEVRVRYDGHARRLWLKAGRAKFDVAHNAARPFTVAAADKLVRATGTAFSVELVQGQVRVVLYEGRVLVSTPAQGPAPLASARAKPAGPAAVPALKPGEELVAPPGPSPVRIAAIDPVRSLSWEAGQLSFEAEPLASAVERMNRYSQETLSVGDPAAGAVRVDGVFEAGDSDAFVEGVTGVLPVMTRDSAEGRVFVGRR